jgi:hypothetical protein
MKALATEIRFLKFQVEENTNDEVILVRAIGEVLWNTSELHVMMHNKTMQQPETDE